MFIITQNSVYAVDTKKKVVSGGKLKSPTPYTHCRLIIGERGIFALPNGGTIITSVIKSY